MGTFLRHNVETFLIGKPTTFPGHHSICGPLAAATARDKGGKKIGTERKTMRRAGEREERQGRKGKDPCPVFPSSQNCR